MIIVNGMVRIARIRNPTTAPALFPEPSKLTHTATSTNTVSAMIAAEKMIPANFDRIPNQFLSY